MTNVEVRMTNGESEQPELVQRPFDCAQGRLRGRQKDE
jgi:hypothetical protein